MVSKRLRSSESLFFCFFSKGSSRKFFTSFDTYFVLLKQLPSLSNEWSTLKKLSCFLCKESEPIQDLFIRGIPRYTLAISILFAISLKFSRTSKKVVINSLHCCLFLNYRKKVGLLQGTRLMPKQV